MEQQKEFYRVLFTPNAIEAFINKIKDIAVDPSKIEIRSLKVDKGNEKWKYDTIDEFLAEIRGEYRIASLMVSIPDISMYLSMWNPKFYPTVNTSIEIVSSSREKILRLSNFVDNFVSDCFIPEPPKPHREIPKPKIFIGHGFSLQWRDLKDHLQDTHGFDVIAYETGARAGHGIRDIIAEMLEKASFAILVMTGEDVMEDGSIMARQNVVHEIGLFQGRLGFTKAIVLKEEGTKEFSNISGVNQIRYSKGNIKESFGDVLGVLRREFGDIR
jgi:hypothetical protein